MDVRLTSFTLNNNPTTLSMPSLTSCWTSANLKGLLQCTVSHDDDTFLAFNKYVFPSALYVPKALFCTLAQLYLAVAMAAMSVLSYFHDWITIMVVDRHEVSVISPSLGSQRPNKHKLSCIHCYCPESTTDSNMIINHNNLATEVLCMLRPLHNHSCSNNEEPTAILQ